MTRSTASNGWSRGDAQTPLQRALVDFGRALNAAASDERTFSAFLSIAASRLSREYGRRIDKGKA